MGMTLEQALADVSDRTSRSVVDRFLETLDADDRLVLLAALAGPLPAARIAKALQMAGHDGVNRGAIEGWRQRNGRAAAA